jgi:hypothetical protein
MVIRYASAILNIGGGVALLLGLLFWSGVALQLVSLHMLLGLLTVAALWVIAAAQLRLAGGSWFFAAGALIIGALTIFLGLRQTTLMVGASHWIIQVIHLLLGILTIGLGHMAKKHWKMEN